MPDVKAVEPRTEFADPRPYVDSTPRSEQSGAATEREIASGLRAFLEDDARTRRPDRGALDRVGVRSVHLRAPAEGDVQAGHRWYDVHRTSEPLKTQTGGSGNKPPIDPKTRAGAEDGGEEPPDDARRTKRLPDGRTITEPVLPPRTIAERGEVRIHHNYRSNDHPPAHMHVRGGGPEVRVGHNGKPICGDDAPTRPQQDVIDENKRAIRRAGDKIGRWLWFNEQ